jgi:Ca-activated chloride channel family protein
VAAVLAVSMLEYQPVARAQPPEATFKSSVAVVPISAVVHDRHGRMVTSLTAADFEVLDKGERRSILDFQAERDSPVSIAVLIDTSGSMRISSKFALAREVVRELSADLVDGRDEVSLFTFDAALHEQQSFTIHPAALDAALYSADPFGVTSLYDAIADTARRLAERPSGHRAIVVLTDGIDNNSESSASYVSSLASSIDVPVYVVATVAPIDRAMYGQRVAQRDARSAATSDFDALAQCTGGDLLWVTRHEEVPRQVRVIVEELRHEYVMAVESATDAEWRPLEIRVRGRRLSVRARRGYFSH